MVCATVITPALETLSINIKIVQMLKFSAYIHVVHNMTDMVPITPYQIHGIHLDNSLLWALPLELSYKLHPFVKHFHDIYHLRRQ